MDFGRPNETWSPVSPFPCVKSISKTTKIASVSISRSAIAKLPPDCLILLKKKGRNVDRISFDIVDVSSGREPVKIRRADFHVQAQVFTEKVSCQGLFWKEK